MIKIEDGGPIFYSQIRSGLDGSGLELRTMKIDAEPNGAQWVKRGDSRIASVGSFLRHSVEWLPQLWCVFTGSGPHRSKA